MSFNKKRKITAQPNTYPMTSLGEQFARLVVQQQQNNCELQAIKQYLVAIHQQMTGIQNSLSKIEEAIDLKTRSSETIPPEYNYYA